MDYDQKLDAVAKEINESGQGIDLGTALLW